MGLLAASLAQTACNTTKGVGRDVQAVGRGVERAGNAP
ncbi:MAG: entericidin A/B family lipoprotein [Verrucomicrobia bacterium]|nr:entericidin A/B family lipoprotein [Verrucomicrobiota bacterium]